MYEKIEALVPGGPYMEFFGRVHNQRLGWNKAIALLKNIPGILFN
jgi:hypothetical protein